MKVATAIFMLFFAIVVRAICFTVIGIINLFKISRATVMGVGKILSIVINTLTFLEQQIANEVQNNIRYESKINEQ